MLNRKLLEVLKRLNAAQIKRLRLFLISPYFNNSSLTEEVVRLFDYIMQFNAEEEHPLLTKEAVFTAFFPGKAYVENSKSPLDNLASELFRLVRKFLAQVAMELEQGDVYEYLALARFYRQYGLEERFEQNMKAARKAQESSPLRDVKYFYDLFRIEEEEVAFRGLYNTYGDDTNLNTAQEYLDLFYSILKLEYTCALKHQNRVAQIELQPTNALIGDILKLSSSGGPLDVPINRVYNLIIYLLEHPDEAGYLEQLEEMLNTYRTQISPERFRNLKAYYRIFWIARYNRSGDAFTRHRNFEIYKEHLEEGYFYFDEMITTHMFWNLIIFGLKMREFEWVKKFIEDHPPERICGTRFPAEIHSIAQAEYYLQLKEYDEAQNYLVFRHFENPFFGITAELTLIRIYFETQNDLLDARMKALDQKIRRSNLNRQIKNRCFNFLKKLDKILKYGWLPKSPKRQKLVEEIKSTPEIMLREWLLEKLQEK